jgi:hypothetical protein
MIICSKCSNPGEFRPGHRQCRECERADGRARYADGKEQAAAYREVHREHYRKLNVENQRRKKADQVLPRQARNPCFSEVPAGNSRASEQSVLNNDLMKIEKVAS